VADGVISITDVDYSTVYGTNIYPGVNGGNIILYGQNNYSGEKTVTFDIEGSPLNNVAITIDPPETGNTPSISANGIGDFSIGAVSWVGNPNIFLGKQRYTATVTLTANNGYKFENPLTTATINGQDANIEYNENETITLSYRFPGVAVAAISLNEANMLLQAGDSSNLIATVWPSDAYNQDVIWSSSDSTVAGIDDDGIITARSAGITTITAIAQDGGYIAICNVTVRQWDFASSTINLVDFSVNVPNSVPIIGDSTFGLNFGSIKTEVERDGNDFKVSIGIDVATWEKDSETDGKWNKEKWKGFKDTFDEMKDDASKNKLRYTQMVQCLKKFDGKVANMVLENKKSANINVCGYIEGTIDDDGRMRIFGGGIIALGEIKYTYQGMIVVVVVPLYYEITTGGELKLVAGIKNYMTNDGVKTAFTGSVTPSIYLEAGGGIGVPLVFTAGAKGRVEVALQVALDRNYQKLSVEGSASFVINGLFGAVSYEKTFPIMKWNIYETPTSTSNLLDSANLYSSSATINNPYAFDLNAPAVFVPFEGTSSAWAGGGSNRLSSYSNIDVTTLQENVSPNIAPILADMNGDKVMAWITENPNRVGINRSMLVYSVYKGGEWTAPVPILDNGAPDYYPAMKDGYIAWQKANTPFENDVTIAELCAASEIFVAKWNGNGFDTPIQLTNDENLNSMPKLAVDGNKVSVVWTVNSENNFMGTTGTNKIMKSDLTTTVALKSGLKAITGMDAAYENGELNVAYIIDGDNDFNTVGDWDLYTTKDGQITDNDTINSNPVFGAINGQTTLFWYDNGGISYKNASGTQSIFGDELPALTDNFSVFENTIIWTTVQNGGAEIHGSIYDGNRWSHEIQITDLGETVKFPSGLNDDNGDLLIAFNRTQKIPDDDYYIDGQSDLCTLSLTPEYDLALTEDYFVDELGQEIIFNVKNNGQRTVESYSVVVDEKSQTVNEALVPGEIREHIMPFNSIGDIDVSVELLSGIENNLSNNFLSFQAGRADLSVESVLIGNGEIIGKIKNIGRSTADQVTVYLREDSEEGAVLAQKVLGDLEAEQEEEIVFPVDIDSIIYDEGYKLFYYTVETISEEVMTGNNREYVVLKQHSDNENDPDSDIQTHLLTITAVEGGSVNNVNGRYKSGEIINITATTNTGYRFIGWTTSNGGIFGNSNNPSTTFTMPDNDTIIIANFEPTGSGNVPNGSSTPGEKETPLGKDSDEEISNSKTQTPITSGLVNPFQDIKETDWFFHDVISVYNYELMLGTSENPMLFSPYANLSRGMIVTVLYRLERSPYVAGLGNPFDDVADGAWYADAVKWAAENEIVKGYDNGKFGQNDNITRQDLVTILNRYANFAGLTLPGTKDYTTFSDDVDIADYAKEAIVRFYKAGIINGYPDGGVHPKGEATRAEFAAMLYRFLEITR